MFVDLLRVRIFELIIYKARIFPQVFSRTSKLVSDVCCEQLCYKSLLSGPQPESDDTVYENGLSFKENDIL